MALSGSLTAAYRVVGLRRTPKITYCAYVQHRFRSYPRSGRGANGPTVKAVFDSDGNKMDFGKLSQLKNEIEQNSVDFGRNPNDSDDFERKPKHSPDFGRRPKDSADFGRRPKDSADFERRPKNSADFGRRPKDSADFGRRPKDSADFGRKTKDSDHTDYVGKHKDFETMEDLKKYSMSNYPVKPKKSSQHETGPTFKNTESEQSSNSKRHGDQRPSNDGIESEEKENEYAGKVPHYTKINGWEKSSSDLKTLGKILTSRQARENSDTVVLEGTRIIRDAVSAGFVPKVVVFSRLKLLHTLDLDKTNNSTKLYHVPYQNIQLWTDLSTSPGIMAAFSKQEIMEGVVADSPLPFSLVCDNIRSPDNLGAVIRCAAAAGVGRIFVTKGCVDVWNSKVVRAAAGAHFLVPIVQDVGWDQLNGYLPSYPQVLLADLVHNETPEDRELVQIQLEELEAECSEEGFHAHEPGEDGVKRDISYLDEELCERYREIPLKTTPYSQFEMRPGVKEGVVVVGGETEGVSGAAYKYCHSHDGERIFVPLRNKINSLNVISATSVVLYRLQQELLKQNP